MNQVKLALAIREGGNVERMHTTPHHGEYSNAKHQWNMAMLLFILHPEPSLTLVRAILEHDIAERWVGDTPGPAKHDINPQLGEILKDTELNIMDKLGLCSGMILMGNERDWLRGLDLLEYMMFCHDELAMGNQNILGSLANVDTAFEKLEGDFPDEIMDFVHNYKWSRSSDNGP